MYAIIDAEGYCGDIVTVWSTHHDEKTARGAKLRGGKSVRLISGCHKQPGDKLPRAAVHDLLARGDWKVVS